MFDMGTSNNQLNATSQQSMTNDISLYLGDGNKGGDKEYGGNTQSNEQSRKDEMGLSAAVGVALGGNASGGQASLQRSGDAEIIPEKIDYIKYLFIGGAIIVVLFVGIFAVKTLKKKKKKA